LKEKWRGDDEDEVKKNKLKGEEQTRDDSPP
jgi:hypothetical protein